MAPQTQVQETRRTKRAAPRRSANGHARRGRATRTRRTRSADIGELEQVIRALEAKIAHLTSGEGIRSTISDATNQVGKAVSGVTNQAGKAVSNATTHVGDMAADMLTEVADRLRTGANSVTGVARSGAGAVQKIGAELERRPIMSVAIALGIGFLAGLAGRRNEQAS